jgi:hypothetical protein
LGNRSKKAWKRISDAHHRTSNAYEKEGKKEMIVTRRKEGDDMRWYEMIGDDRRWYEMIWDDSDKKEAIFRACDYPSITAYLLLLALENWAGSFMYHYGKNLVSIGYVVALDYQNPYIRYK